MFKGFVEGLRSLVVGGPSDGDERRRLIRLKSRYPVNCNCGNVDIRGVVTDMSMEGLQFLGNEALKPGTHVNLSLLQKAPAPSFAPVLCRVLWCRQYKLSGRHLAGMKYDDTPANMTRSWVKKVLRELGFTENTIYQQRKKMRLITDDLDVHVGTVNVGTIGRGHVRNLGVGGVLIEVETAIPRALTLQLVIGPLGNLPVLKVDGTVLSHENHKARQTHLHRIRFDTMTPATVKLLGQYVIALLRRVEH